MDSSRGRQPGLCGQIPGRQILVRDYRRRANHRRGSRVPDQRHRGDLRQNSRRGRLRTHRPHEPTLHAWGPSRWQRSAQRGSYHFLTRDSALLLRWRIALDSSAVHALDATFKIFAAHHGRLLLDCCHAGTHARSVRRLAWRAFIPRTRSTAGHVAVFCCIPGCHEAAKSGRVRRRLWLTSGRKQS